MEAFSFTKKKGKGIIIATHVLKECNCMRMKLLN